MQPGGPDLVIGLQAVCLIMLLYHVLIAPAGFWQTAGGKRRRHPADPSLPADPPRHRFAVIVPAHNEEAVLCPLLRNLRGLDYPADLYDVYVVADNCTDRTAAVALCEGARVLERRDPRRRGKAFALKFAFDRILGPAGEGAPPYDAFVVVDADNLVAPNFLRAMATRLARGERVIQVYLDVKNPNDTWVTASFAISYWVSNRFWCLARANLGLTVPLGGTGMCIDVGVLRTVGWGTETLTEDLEFTARALLGGVRTHWAHEAAVYDEKPLTFAGSWAQRLRWVQGGVQVACRHAGALLWRGLRQRDAVMLEGAVLLCRPFFLVVATAAALIRLSLRHLGLPWFYAGALSPEVAWGALFSLQWLLPLVSIWLDRVPLRPFRFLPLFPLFVYSWIPITWLGVIRARRSTWTHTRHTRGITYEELRAQRADTCRVRVQGL